MFYPNHIRVLSRSALKLTDDDDPALRVLMNRIREDFSVIVTAPKNSVLLLIDLRETTEADKIYNIRDLSNTTNEQLAYSYQHIALIRLHQGEYQQAIDFSERALFIWQQILQPSDPILASSYNNIAMVYCRMGEYSEALGHFEKALRMREKSLPANHPDVATSYNNIGATFFHLEDFRKALSYFEEALNLYGKTLPSNHPKIAVVSRWIDATRKKILAK